MPDGIAQFEQVAVAIESAVVDVRLAAGVLETQPGQDAVAAGHAVLEREAELVQAAAERELRRRMLVRSVGRRQLALQRFRRLERAEVHRPAAGDTGARRTRADSGGQSDETAWSEPAAPPTIGAPPTVEIVFDELRSEMVSVPPCRS